jgi:hypothetical protein
VDTEDRGILPITLSTSLLLDAFGISVDMARFGKVSGEVIFSSSSSVRKAGVVSVVVLLGTSH